MIDTSVIDISSWIVSKKNQLEEARRQLSMYSDLIARLEMEISVLENASEMTIGGSDGKKSIIYKRDPDEPTINYYSSIGHRYHGMSITEYKGGKQ